MLYLKRSLKFPGESNTHMRVKGLQTKDKEEWQNINYYTVEQKTGNYLNLSQPTC